LDNLQSAGTSVSTIVYEDVQTTTSLVANLNEDQVSLSWQGTSDEYRIYRSTTPISSVVGLTMFDELPTWGEETPQPLRPVGTTEYLEWSEPVPIATNLYYAVTSVVDGREVVWIVDGENHVSIDASSIASSGPEPVDEASQLTTTLISGVMASLGIISLALAIYDNRRRSK
jgi:hypothetical protein